MPNGLNKVMLIGNLGGSPELRYTDSGTALMTINIATNERRKIRDEWKDVAEWHRVIVWGKRAEALSKFLNKGSHIYIEGGLQTRNWNDKNGSKHYTTEVVARQVLLLGKKNDNRGGDHAPPPDDSHYNGGYSSSNKYDDSSDSGGGDQYPQDDLPF